jgi:hypothetical protein
MFPKVDWTFKLAEKWVYDHNYEPLCWHDYPNFWRFSITNKSPARRYRYKVLDDEPGHKIEAVFEFKK